MTTWRRGINAVLIIFLAVLGVRCASAQPAVPTWINTAPLLQKRYIAGSALLPSGKILVAGGFDFDFLTSAEVFDPASGVWVNAAPLPLAHRLSATLLHAGEILVVGDDAYSSPTPTAYVYSEATLSWIPAGPPSIKRYQPAFVVLLSGPVLMVGGYDGHCCSGPTGTYQTTEIYNRGANVWSSAASMSTRRVGHTATLLGSGKVLVAGGSIRDPVTIHSTSELYNPVANSWSATTGSMTDSRSNHTATLLASGKVLVVGGFATSYNDFRASTELYDPATGTWSMTGSLAKARANHTATLLPSGKVLVAGGQDSGGVLNTAEIYDPDTGTWSPAGTMADKRASHTASLLPGGRILVAGGLGISGTSLASAEIFALLPPVMLTTLSPLSPGTVGVPYSQGFAATGGAPPYRFDAFGDLPPGLGVTGAGAGVLTGTPSKAGTYSFSVEAVDSLGLLGSRNYTLTIASSLTISTPSSLTSATAGMAYSQTITASLGTPPYTFAFAGAPPAGFSLSAAGQLSGLAANPGMLAFSIQVTDSQGAVVTKQFQLTVMPAPPLAASTGGLSLSVPAMGDKPPTQTISVASGTGAPVPFQVTVDSGSGGAAPSWLSVTPMGGTAPAILTVSFDQGQLAAGTYTARIRITPLAGGAAPTDVTVTLTVVSKTPKVDASPSLLEFTAGMLRPGPFDQSLILRNSGGGTLNFTVTADPARWLILTGASGTMGPNSPARPGVRVNAQGLRPGGYRTVLHIATQAGITDVPVTLFVAPGGAVLGVDLIGARFDSRQGTPLGFTQNVSVLNQGDSGSTANWVAKQVAGGDWLSLGVTKGTSTPAIPGVLPLSISATGTALPPGAYYALVQITDSQSGNSPQYVVAVLNQQAATAAIPPTLAPAGLLFVAGPALSSQSFQVYGVPLTGLTLNAQTSDAQKWLSATAGPNPGQVTVAANATGLSPGVHNGTVNVSVAGFVIANNITLVVPRKGTAAGNTTQATADCTPANLAIAQTGLAGSFQVPARWPQALTVTLIDDCGTAVMPASVKATFSNGDTPLALPAIGQSNLYSATWQPLSNATQATVTIEANAAGFPRATAQFSGSITPNKAPILNRYGAVNNLNPEAGAALAPGTVLGLYGSDLAGTTAGMTGLPLPTFYLGTGVFIGGTRSPLYFVSPGQVNAQIPVELISGNQVRVVVSANGAALTLPELITLNPVSPGAASFADGHIVAQHASYTLIDADHPAHPGEIVQMYLAGLGDTDPVVPSGYPAPSREPLARVTVRPTVTVNGVDAPVSYAGLTPGAVGLYQINFQVPTSTTTGDAAVIITQGDAVANTVTIPVAPTP